MAKASRRGVRVATYHIGVAFCDETRPDKTGVEDFLSSRPEKSRVPATSHAFIALHMQGSISSHYRDTTATLRYLTVFCMWFWFANGVLWHISGYHAINIQQAFPSEPLHETVFSSNKSLSDGGTAKEYPRSAIQYPDDN